MGKDEDEKAKRVKGTVSRDFRLLAFFHKSVSPKHLSIIDTGGKFAPVSLTPVVHLD